MVSLCETCKHTRATYSLSGHHVTCRIDGLGYNYTPASFCLKYETKEEEPEDFIQEDEMYV